MKFLVDANVLCEPTRPAPDAGALQWLRKHEADLVVNPIILGEIEYGILQLSPGRKRTQLARWFTKGIQRLRTLDFDAATASIWAALLARLRARGLGMPVKDSLVAATAIAHGLTVATRNVTDFRNAGVPLVNPFVSRAR